MKQCRDISIENHPYFEKIFPDGVRKWLALDPLLSDALIRTLKLEWCEENLESIVGCSVFFLAISLRMQSPEVRGDRYGSLAASVQLKQAEYVRCHAGLDQNRRKIWSYNVSACEHNVRTTEAMPRHYSWRFPSEMQHIPPSFGFDANFHRTRPLSSVSGSGAKSTHVASIAIQDAIFLRNGTIWDICKSAIKLSLLELHPESQHSQFGVNCQFLTVLIVLTKSLNHVSVIESPP